MPKVISVHEYVLKEDADADQFDRAIRKAREEGIPDVPGLEEYYLVKGIRGAKKDHYAAIWIYENPEAWAMLWGPPDQPLDKEDYPNNWKTWEEHVLAPFLDRDPDTIRFTAYREL